VGMGIAQVISRFLAGHSGRAAAAVHPRP